MDNDLFIATETLQNAFKEVLKNEKNKSRKWGMRWQVKRLKEAIEQRHLTVSEKLLLCYGPSEDLFTSRDSKKKAEQDFKQKAKQVHDEQKELFEAFLSLPEEEQDRIRKELGLDKLFPSKEELLKNNTTTPLEHNDNEGQENGE